MEKVDILLATYNGEKYIREHNLMNTYCPQLVADVMEILEEIMGEEN